MNTIRDGARNPIVIGAAVVGLVIGLILGLVYAWQINPVEWTDANPSALSAAWQEEYLRMSIRNFGASGDAATAQRQYLALGDVGQDTMAKVAQTPEDLNSDLIASYSTIVTGSAVAPAVTPGAQLQPGTPTAALPGQVTPMTGEEPEEEGGRSSLVTTLIVAICVVLLLILAGVGYLFLRGRNLSPASGAAQTPAQVAIEQRRQTGLSDFVAEGNEPPAAQFMASYKLGDDLFDDSFSVDSPNGEFLGECGVGISETIGVGEPKKVTAFEVWLFDKNDIQTVTKVLMSVHAFQDGTIRQRLEAKGEPVQADSGIEFVLETQTLQMVARVANMGYGEGAMPPQSYFDHLLLELAIWQK